jgi:hypothetical protein
LQNQQWPSEAYLQNIGNKEYRVLAPN